jgi:hypothetical protein
VREPGFQLANGWVMVACTAEVLLLCAHPVGFRNGNRYILRTADKFIELRMPDIPLRQQPIWKPISADLYGGFKETCSCETRGRNKPGKNAARI